MSGVREGSPELAGRPLNLGGWGRGHHEEAAEADELVNCVVVFGGHRGVEAQRLDAAAGESPRHLRCEGDVARSGGAGARVAAEADGDAAAPGERDRAQDRGGVGPGGVDVKVCGRERRARLANRGGVVGRENCVSRPERLEAGGQTLRGQYVEHGLALEGERNAWGGRDVQRAEMAPGTATNGKEHLIVRVLPSPSPFELDVGIEGGLAEKGCPSLGDEAAANAVDEARDVE